MKRFTLRLTQEEYIKLKSYCEEIQVSMNDTIRQLIREWSPDKKIQHDFNDNNKEIHKNSK
ncbi:MAG: hypothetical protein Tsb0014_29890 [Pleurocapsa sp.]